MSPAVAEAIHPDGRHAQRCRNGWMILYPCGGDAMAAEEPTYVGELPEGFIPARVAGVTACSAISAGLALAVESANVAEAIAWIERAEALLDQAHAALKAEKWGGFAKQAWTIRQQAGQLAIDIKGEAD